MYDNMIYTNSNGNTINFGVATTGKGILINENDMRSFTKKYESKFDRVSILKKDIVEKKLTVIVFAPTTTEVRELVDEITNIIGADTATDIQGKMQIGNYYMTGYFIGAEQIGYTKDYDMVLQLTFVTDSPKWVKEVVADFSVQPILTSFGQYPMKYPARYASLSTTQTLINYHYSSSPLKIVFYGPCISPNVLINGILYKVNTTVADGEYIAIDARDKTVILVRTNGDKVNVFNLQDRDFYIFSEIPAGANIVAWDGSFPMEITIYEERNEPKWM